MSIAILSSRSSASSPFAANRYNCTQRVLCSGTPADHLQTGTNRRKGRDTRSHRCFQGRKKHYRRLLLILQATNTEVVDTSAALDEGLIEMKVKVNGMTCGHCTSRVEDALTALPAAVWDWFAATWAAMTGEDAPPQNTDLLLADDQRTWRPATQLRPLWHSLRLATIYHLWAAYQRARHQPVAAQSAGAVAARILSSSRKALLGDWRLATVTIRQTEGVLSDWLRGGDPKLTREEFRERWCHRNILCVLGAEPDAQLLNHWSAHRPVPLLA